jgi:Tfp pilus assembly PilM family ATPase
MHNIRKCLGIDIGSTSVKLAEVVAERSGARVTKLVRAEIPIPAGPMDAARVNATVKCVRDLLKNNKITTKHAVFCLPGQSVFIRRIRVPRTTEERLHRIVAYEARQQIPFALDNSLMEYQVFDHGDGPEVEVLLVAIKKDIVLDYMKVVNRVGLKPVLISVSSLALFNLHVFDSTAFDDLLAELGVAKKKALAPVAAAMAEPPGEEEAPAPAPAKKGFSLKLPKLNLNFGKKAVKSGPDEGSVALEEEPEDYYEEVRAYVNIGAQTFDLAISRLGRHKLLGFTRSVPWAGNELTRSLQEKLELDSADSAEEVKRGKAIVVVPGREDEVESGGADPDASEFTTAWADRLILDLRKSFDYYISQPDGVAVDSIWLSGGQAVQPNLASYIEEKLGIPVEIKSQVENQALRVPAVEDDAGYSPFWIAIGLGLTGVGFGRITVDFLPGELKTLREFKKKNVEVFLLIGAILGMIGVSSQVGQRDINNMQQWLKQNETKIETAGATKNTLAELRKERDSVNTKFTSLGEALGDRAFWLDFLGMVQIVKPGDVLITAISMKPDGEVEIRCETEVVGSVSSFAEALKNQKEWIAQVDLTDIQVRFSSFVNKEVNSFRVLAKTHWKQTRLATARVTLAPGLMAPTPAPTPAGPVPGAMPGMVPGGPPGMQIAI